MFDWGLLALRSAGFLLVFTFGLQKIGWYFCKSEKQIGLDRAAQIQSQPSRNFDASSGLFTSQDGFVYISKSRFQREERLDSNPGETVLQ